MMIRIKASGTLHGDPDGCIICHGGNPEATTKDQAHTGIPPSLQFAPGPKLYYPSPGSIWIADNTCGVCHPGYVYRLKLGLMSTETGKIQGNLTTWGVIDAGTSSVSWGNYRVKDIDTLIPQVGSNAYKAYMQQQVERYPRQYPQQLDSLPEVTTQEVAADPKLAAISYQRKECQRCHIGVRGRKVRGDYRGLGCAACHILYGKDGYYQGGDTTIPRDEPGHLFTHQIRGSRKTGGIPVGTCSSCHNRGKRIGVSYQGLIESPSNSFVNNSGQPQPPLHSKSYLFLSDDLHHQQRSRAGNPTGGLLCQDCHTSIDVHGDGNIHGTTLAQVEIECTDCHGLPGKYPWELPLGFGDEFGKKLSLSQRGVASELLAADTLFGFLYQPEDGYLLSARGNPLGNVVRRDNTVILYSGSGGEFTVPVLKEIRTNSSWRSPSAQIAMLSVKKHLDNLECYSCHSSWAPQCYGCHVQVTYRSDKYQPVTSIDWVASGSEVMEDGETAESRRNSEGIHSVGRISETLSYLRWENPTLGINGEGRVSPLIPGCQVSFTVIGEQGELLANNLVAINPLEGKQIGQKHVPLALDMAPVQPHTSQRNARSCESCHADRKTAGLGIGLATNSFRFNEQVNDDLTGLSGEIKHPLEDAKQFQLPPGLLFDWSQIIDQDGRQLVTVGTHWPLSRAFNRNELGKFLRTGACLGCHQNMANSTLWSRVNDDSQLNSAEHSEMLNNIIQYLSRSGVRPARAINSDPERQ